MYFTVSRTFTFSAAHFLPQLPAGHPCAKLHGQSYSVRVKMSARDIDADGFVRDDISGIEQAIKLLDGANLCELITPEYTTPECLSAILFAVCRKLYPEVHRVSVCDRPERSCAYEGSMPPNWARQQATALLAAIENRRADAYGAHDAPPRDVSPSPPTLTADREAARPIARE
jgi:6-pyruvoyltetrahydropterin/6-carboxytetrahydropterin synthase